MQILSWSTSHVSMVRSKDVGSSLKAMAAVVLHHVLRSWCARYVAMFAECSVCAGAEVRGAAAVCTSSVQQQCVCSSVQQEHRRSAGCVCSARCHDVRTGQGRAWLVCRACKGSQATCVMLHAGAGPAKGAAGRGQSAQCSRWHAPIAKNNCSQVSQSGVR